MDSKSTIKEYYTYGSGTMYEEKLPTAQNNWNS